MRAESRGGTVVEHPLLAEDAADREEMRRILEDMIARLDTGEITGFAVGFTLSRERTGTIFSAGRRCHQFQLIGALHHVAWRISAAIVGHHEHDENEDA